MREAELDFIVKDSLVALKLYETIFEVEKIEVGDFVAGENEVVFSIYNLTLHMLDENKDFGMIAPSKDTELPFWFNVSVPKIEETFQKATDSGCTVIQEITELPEMGIKNAMFKDPFGYMWMLHQVDRKVDYETRASLLEEQGFSRFN